MTRYSSVAGVHGGLCHVKINRKWSEISFRGSTNANGSCQRLKGTWPDFVIHGCYTAVSPQDVCENPSRSLSKGVFVDIIRPHTLAVHRVRKQVP